MRTLRVKNWRSFQHYKDRSPTWIKLHKALLDDFDYHSLPVASRALAPMIWLLASESDDGSVPHDFRRLAYRLRMTEKEVKDAIEPLIKGGFVEIDADASESLAEPEHDASPEKRTTSENNSREQPKKESISLESEFADWYAIFPRHVGRGQALKAYQAARKTASAETLLAGARRYAAERAGEDKQFTKHPATWLNGQCWLDEPEEQNHAATGRRIAEDQTAARRRAIFDAILGPDYRDGGESGTGGGDSPDLAHGQGMGVQRTAVDQGERSGGVVIDGSVEPPGRPENSGGGGGEAVRLRGEPWETTR